MPARRAAVASVLVAALALLAPRETGAVCAASADDPGEPRVKTSYLTLPEAAQLTWDEASYHEFTRVVHATTVVVAVHRGWDGVAGTPPVDAYADFVFQVFELHWRVFCGYPYDRFFVIVRPPADLSATVNTRLGFVVTGEKDHAAFLRYTGVAPHDVFHVWLRQIIFADAAGGAPGAIAPEAWFYEGATEYYQHRAFVALGNRPGYFTGLAAHRRTYARLRGTPIDLPVDQLAAQVSPPAPANNESEALLYAKGTLLAYLLDRALLVQGKNLDDLLQSLYATFGLAGRGFRTSDVAAALAAVTGRDFTTFFARYVTGTDPLPLVGQIDHVDHDTNAVTEPGNPAVKATRPDTRLPAGYLDADPASYHLFTLDIHGTRVTVAVHRSLDGVSRIGGYPTPAREDFAQQMFDAFEESWHVFGGFRYDRFVVKVQALTDPQPFVGASWNGVVLSAVGVDLASATAPPHPYTVPFYREWAVHEMFHAWTGGTIQTALTGRSDSSGPYYEESFFIEGFTDYYDIRSLQATGNAADYARKMETARDGYLRRVGTESDLPFAGLATRANAAFGPGSPSGDASDLIVWKGTLVAYLLDRVLAGARRSLDDLMRVMYERFGLRDRSFRTADVVAALGELGGRDFQPLFDRYVTGNERLPVDGALDFVDHATGPSSVMIATDQPSYRRGEVHTVTLSTRARAGDSVDLYVAIVLPGQRLLFYTLDAFTAAPAAVSRATPVSDSSRTILSAVVPATLPAGRYTWGAVLARPGASPFDSASWIDVSTASFTVE